MFKQNYINIFENAGGNVTVAYATCGDDPLQMDEVQCISIEGSDLELIASVLKELSTNLSSEG